MSKELGGLRYLHYGVESAYGAGVTGAGTCIPVMDCDLRQRVERDRPQWYDGTAKRRFEIKRRIWVEGSVTIPLYDSIIEDVLDLILERTSVATGFDMANSWGIREYSLNEAREFLGLMANRGSLSASSDSPEVRAAIDFLGQKEENDDLSSRGALPAGQPYLFQCATVTWFSETETTLCTAFEINIENNLQLNDGPVDCDGYPYYLVGGARAISGSISLLFDSAENRQRLRNETEGSLVIVLNNGSVSPAGEVTITIPRFTLDEVPEDKDPEGISVENIPFEAIADDSDDDITYVVA